MKRTENRR